MVSVSVSLPEIFCVCKLELVAASGRISALDTWLEWNPNYEVSSWVSINYTVLFSTITKLTKHTLVLPTFDIFVDFFALVSFLFCDLEVLLILSSCVFVGRFLVLWLGLGLFQAVNFVSKQPFLPMLFITRQSWNCFWIVVRSKYA